jgi:flagellar biogenesis protein FliO
MALCAAVMVALSGASVARCEETPTRQWGASTTQSTPDVAPFNAQSSVLRMVGGLFLCVGLFGFGIHLYKRYLLPRSLSSDRRLKVVERLQLTQKSSLLLVTLDGKEFLVSTGAEQSRLITPPKSGEEFFDESLSTACADVGEFNA